MRRTSLATAAVMLSLGAAGCGGQAPHPAPSAERPHTTASNRTEARADAQKLVALVRVPSGASLATTPRDTGFEQPQDFVGVWASATASRTWIVHASVDRLLRYVVAHLPPGSKLDSTGRSVGADSVDESQIRSWPPVAGVLDGRWLQLQAYTHGTHTYLTARAQSQWVITREAREQIPSDVTKIAINVRDANGHTIHELTVATPRIVHRVVALYNSLGVVQPATIMGCPPEPGGVLTLTFYDSPTHVIATASSPADANPPWPPSAAAWECFPIKVRLGQHSYPSLSGNVITPLGKLLHARLTPRPA